MKSRYGEILFKTKRGNLLAHKEKIDKMKYPFLPAKAERVPAYLLCNEKSSFFYRWKCSESD